MHLKPLSALLLMAPLATCVRAQESPAVSLEYFERAGARIAYTVDRPDGPGPHPAVVIVPAAGPRQTIDVLQGWATRFLGLGFVVLRYDKRGTGSSSGRYRDVNPASSSSVIPELAADAAMALDVLRRLPGIDTTRIGLAGGSQAGWVIPEAASLTGVRFVVVFSGPAVPVGWEIRHARRVADGLDSAALREDLQTFRGELGYDPVPALERMHIPAIWVLGSRDERVPVPETVRLLDSLRVRDHRPWTIEVMEGADHQLRIGGSSQMNRAWQEVDSWLSRQGVR
jgi:dienelactone hydrolase